jgi:hypothetical protein
MGVVWMFGFFRLFGLIDSSLYGYLTIFSGDGWKKGYKG